MNRKRRGELSELAFIHKATARGFNVSKPYGDSCHYDFLVENRGRIVKVQVKCTSYLDQCGGYLLNCRRRLDRRCIAYGPHEIDFLAGHVIPEDAWYIVPLSVVGSKHGVCLFPHIPQRDRLYGAYREAWHLLEGAAPGSEFGTGCPLLFNIDACAEVA